MNGNITLRKINEVARLQAKVIDDVCGELESLSDLVRFDEISRDIQNGSPHVVSPDIAHLTRAVRRAIGRLEKLDVAFSALAESSQAGNVEKTEL